MNHPSRSLPRLSLARTAALAALASLFIGLGAGLSLVATAAAPEPYIIGAIFDMTGPGAPLGTPEEQAARMVVDQVNAKGGINGHPVKLIVYDNGSDESNSVKVAKKLIEADKVLAIVGTSQTGTTLALADTLQASRIPLISCGSGVGIVTPVKPYIFKTAQSDVHAAAKVLEYLKAQKLTKVALVSVSNAFGDSGKAQLEAQAAKFGISFVVEESFGDKDTDMTAQLMGIRGSAAKAVVCWGTNPGPAIFAKNMQSLRIDLPLIMSHGIANKTFLDLAGDAASEGIVFPAGKLIVADEIPASDPQRKVLLGFAADFRRVYGKDADTFAGHAFDAVNLVLQAVRKVGPDREKIRAAIEKTDDYVGISGEFNFTPADHNGLTKDAFVMVRISKGDWKLVK